MIEERPQAAAAAGQVLLDQAERAPLVELDRHEVLLPEIALQSEDLQALPLDSL